VAFVLDCNHGTIGTVGGMTCSSCIGAIKGALKNFGWIKRVDINLLSNSATVIFEGKDHLPEIARVIEDIGYEATQLFVDFYFPSTLLQISNDSRRAVITVHATDVNFSSQTALRSYSKGKIICLRSHGLSRILVTRPL
jgi:copper chaperone CopZ